MRGTDIAAAAGWLQEGDVVAIPTETVYGLAASMYSRAGIEKIFRVKNRPHTNPLIVHIAGKEQLAGLVQDVPEIAYRLAAACWPGPLTMVLPKSSRVDPLITAGQPTVAVRVPAHPLTLELLQKTGFPLVAPSANKYNYISPVTATAVEEMLGGEIPYILDGGPCTVGIESTIISFEETGQVRILRRGGVTEEQIALLTGRPPLTSSSKGVLHPGMSQKHYAPSTPLVLLREPGDAQAYTEGKSQVALMMFSDRFGQVRADKKVKLSITGELSEAASRMYNTLYELDKDGYDLILAEAFPDKGLGRSLNERLEKAAAPR